MKESLMDILKIFTLPTCGGHSVLLDCDRQGKSYLYRSNVNQKQDVFLYDTETGRTECITESEKSSGMAYSSPNGRYVCYAKDENGSELYIFKLYNTATKQIEELPAAASFTYLFAVDWAADSSGFIRSCTSGGENYVEWIDVQARTCKRIFTWKDPLMSARLSSNGAWLACTAYDGDSYLVLVPLKHPEACRIIRPEGSTYNASPIFLENDDSIFYISGLHGFYQPAVYFFADERVKYYDLEAGEELLTFSQIAPFAQFDAVGKAVYCLVSKRSVDYVKRIDLTSGKAETIELGNYNVEAIVLKDPHTLGVVMSSMNRPQAAYLYDLERKQLCQISRKCDDESVTSLSCAESLEFPSSDGTMVQGWFLAAAGSEKGTKPALLVAHGGPREHFANNWFNGLYLQVFSKLGINVFAVNFRGSTSFGYDFLRKNIGDLGNGDVADMAAAAKLMVQEKDTDPTRISVMGASYGGYLTLMTLARRSDVFRCGISMVPPVDWAFQYGVSNARFQNIIKYLHDGTPEEVPETYARSNVLNYVDGIRSPLLVIASENDFRCPIEPIYALQKQLGARGADSEFVIHHLGHEGMFENTNNQMADLAAMIGFLTKQFGLEAPAQ